MLPTESSSENVSALTPAPCPTHAKTDLSRSLNLPSSTTASFSYPRLFALIVLTFGLLMIGVFRRAGVRLQNILGSFKPFILAGIAALGLLSLAGFPGLAVRSESEQPDNFDLGGVLEGQ